MSNSKSVDGFKTPTDGPITANEIAWIVFLRLLTDDTDPKPTLRLIQALRLALQGAEGKDRQ